MFKKINNGGYGKFVNSCKGAVLSLCKLVVVLKENSKLAYAQGVKRGLNHVYLFHWSTQSLIDQCCKGDGAHNYVIFMDMVTW